MRIYCACICVNIEFNVFKFNSNFHPEPPADLSSAHPEAAVDSVSAVANAGPPSSDSERANLNERLSRCRQMKALRIFTQLIPDHSLALLARLLRFLHSVAQCKETRMNFNNLGIIFGSVLFDSKSEPSAATAATQRLRLDSINRATAFLIDHCHRLTEVSVYGQNSTNPILL